MRAFFLSILLLGAISAKAEVGLTFSTSDGETIATDLYSGPAGAENVVVVAPGFAQHKGTEMMQSLCKAFARQADVICVDFRGTGKSTGWFTFGAKEYLDLQPILSWTASNYRRTTLVGFSLGAYTSFRAAATWPQLVQKLMVVSCPTKFEDIITSGGAFANAWKSIIDPKTPTSQTGADWIFHWGYPFMAKPDLADLASQVTMPTAFLVGGQDRLVFTSLSQKVFAATTSPAKTWTEIPDGDHAESMFLQHPELVMNWFMHAFD